MNDLTTIDEDDFAAPAVARKSVFDTERFKEIMAVAEVMAMSSLIPESLRFDIEVDTNGEPISNKKRELPYEQIRANCFLICNWSAGVGMDPFAVAQGTSIVRGRLMFEGKIVHAALTSTLGVKLKALYGVWDPAKAQTIVGGEANGKDLAVRIYEESPDGSIGRHVDGYVGGWETTGKNSPWALNKDWRKQLVYRGSREWARVYEPGVMLGVITPDEYEPAWDRMRDVTPTRQQSTGTDVIDRLKAAKSGATDKPAAGFDQARINEIAKAPEAPEEGTTASGDGEAQSTINPATVGKDPAKSDSFEGENPRPTAPDYDWLRAIAKGLWAATNFKGDISVLKNKRIGLGGTYPSKGKPQAIVDKAKAIMGTCTDVCEGRTNPADARKLIAGIAGMEVRELAEKA
jgi:hypothetical protein